MAKRQEFSSLSLGSPLRSEVALLHFPRDMILRVRCRYPWSKLSGRTGEARKRQRFLLIPPTRYLFIFFAFFRQARARARRACAGAEREWLATEGRLTSLLLAWKTRKNSLFSNSPQYNLFAPQILHKPLFLNAPGSIAFSQEHFKTISYAKFGGQTECIMGNWKIVNNAFSAGYRHSFFLGYDTHTFSLALVQRR